MNKATLKYTHNCKCMKHLFILFYAEAETKYFQDFWCRYRKNFITVWNYSKQSYCKSVLITSRLRVLWVLQERLKQVYKFLTNVRFKFENDALYYFVKITQTKSEYMLHVSSKTNTAHIGDSCIILFPEKVQSD